MTQNYYDVKLQGKHVGFSIASTWGEAQRKTARKYNKENQTNYSWEDFEAKVVLEKFYNENGLEPINKTGD